jgi:hypothetical protein
MAMKIDWLWIENPGTKQADTMLTFAIVAFSIVCFKFLFSGFTINLPWSLGAWVIQPADAGIVGTLLGSTLTAYVARRYTDKKFDTDGDGIPDSDTPKKD